MMVGFNPINIVCFGFKDPLQFKNVFIILKGAHSYIVIKTFSLIVGYEKYPP